MEARSQEDDESVVGDEWHIVSAQANGPRHDPSFPKEYVDGLDNLILLCRVHHKLVDDQASSYTAERLQETKASYEKWVETALQGAPVFPPIRLRRIKQNIPPFLVRLTSGQDLMAVVEGACAYAMGHDELENDPEVELVASFLQELEDWGDLWRDVGAGERTRISFQLGRDLKAIEEAGFAVFGGRELQRIEGGAAAPTDWPVAIVKVVRVSNPDITMVDPDKGAKDHRASGAADPKNSKDVV